MHGKLFEVGDLVWLHFSSCVKREISEAPPPIARAVQGHPKKLSDVTYRTLGARRKEHQIVVHFDHLKPCHPGTRFHYHTDPSAHDNFSMENTNFGSRLEIIDGEDSAEVSAIPSLNDGGVESEGAESETEHDVAEHDAS